MQAASDDPAAGIDKKTSRYEIPMKDSPTLPCWIYRCSRRDEMYLYLAEQDHFDCVPPAVRRLLGRLEAVMALELHPQSRLARVDAATVCRDLRERGFFIQLPPAHSGDLPDS